MKEGIGDKIWRIYAAQLSSDAPLGKAAEKIFDKVYGVHILPESKPGEIEKPQENLPQSQPSKEERSSE